uniref:RCC1-like G exchanging factor-like protein isoform X2 n=1 Tax=Myxine glutinosa TaxID=7769 RepID=UPI00358E10D4
MKITALIWTLPSPLSARVLYKAVWRSEAGATREAINKMLAGCAGSFCAASAFPRWTLTRLVSRQPRPSRQDPSLPVFQYVGKRVRRKDYVFVWGFTNTGALGIPSFLGPGLMSEGRRKVQFKPYRLEMPNKITSAACGYGFTLLASSIQDITKVWGTGLNKDSQLGFQRSRRDRTKCYDLVLKPSPVALPLRLPQGTRVVQVACGRAHSLILTDNEGVFSLGNNAYGQCGRKVIEDEDYNSSHVVHAIRGFGDQVAEVVCGQDHSLFLTVSGKVYACGWGVDGQTGLGSYNVCDTPRMMAGDLAGVPVAQVASYCDVGLAVSRSGDLFGWGNSEYLQLAVATDETQLHTPKHLPFNNVGKVKMAAAGDTACALLNAGEVFVWGYGILGKGPQLSESHTPQQIPPTLFGWSEMTPDVRVGKIRCGLHHFAAINNRGELFVWGKNTRGCLGIARLEDQYFPWRVTVPGEVLDVACGVDHMIALIKSFI